MRNVIRYGVFLGLVGSVVVTSAAGETVYTIDPARSEIVVQVFKAGVGATLAHDHVVRATGYVGRIHYDPGAPTRDAITVEVPTASLKVDEPAIRQKYNLPSSLGEQDRQEIQETMMSTDQLDVEHYTLMRVASTRIEVLTKGVYTVIGELTIRGITQSVTFPVRVEQRGNTLQIQGSFRLKQSRFGYEPYSALWGAIRNQDEVLLHFDMVASPLGDTK